MPEKASPGQGNDHDNPGTLISACGFRCDLCGAFAGNLAGPGDQRDVAAEWKKFYDIDMAPDRIICDGCRNGVVEGRELPARDCRTRTCVAERELENCGHCEEYPCERLDSVMGDVERTREKFEGSISEEERRKFFEPYRARRNFEEIRMNLR
jgi:hypothetical protein